jgi:tetratricopeptide (TPR) repeat protein
MPEIVFISGEVIQDDGSPPPFGTVIELDCGNTITREATVDSEGHYGFQVGSSNRIGRVMADASDRIDQDVFDVAQSSQSLANAGFSASMRTTPLSIRLLRCEVRAQYPGYRSTSVRMRAGAISGFTQINTILLYRLEKVKGSSVSLTSMMAPKEAKKLAGKASKALQKNKPDEAEKLLRSALQIHPQYAEAYYLLGQICQIRGRNEDAREKFEQAIAADGLYVGPYLQLARLELVEAKWQIAADHTTKALELDPVGYPEAYYLDALARYELRDLMAAERSARMGLRLDLNKQYPRLYLVLASILAVGKDNQGSVKAMKDYLKAAPKAKDAPAVRKSLEEIESLAKAATR